MNPWRKVAWACGVVLALAGFLAPGLHAASARPVITSHPQSQIVSAGQTVSFSVEATGNGPLSYRWAFNESLLPEATNSVLTILNVTQANTGNYAAIVFNSHGFAVSDPATLTVLQPSIPIITQHPQSQTAAPGSSVSLAVAYSGTGPFSVQWRRNGVSIPGATGDAFALGNIQPADAGDYTAVVSTAAGSAASNPAAVRVTQSALRFSDAFDSHFTLRAASGSGQASNMAATREPGEPDHAGKPGAHSVWIAWQPNVSGIAAISLAGSSFDTLLAVYTGDAVTGLTEVASDDDGGGYLSSEVRFNAAAGTSYKIAVDGLSGAAGDFTFAWSLEPTPDRLQEIILPPINQTVGLSDAALFTVQATGVDLSFQWFFDGQPVAGETSDALNIPSVTESQVGSYSVRVTSGSRATESAAATLQVNIGEELPQPVLAADKLADASQPLVLGEEPTALDGASESAVAASPGINRGYTGSQIFSTVGAVSEAGEPLHCNLQGGASQWIMYVAQHDGDLALNTDGSSFDTILAVYTGPGTDYASLQSVGCDNNSGIDGRDSKVKVRVQQGQTYYVVVDGVNGAKGKVRLNYSLATPGILRVLTRSQTATNLRLTGQKKGTFVVETSGDSLNWMPLRTNTLPNGVYDFTHLDTSGKCFFRARTLQP